MNASSWAELAAAGKTRVALVEYEEGADGHLTEVVGRRGLLVGLTTRFEPGDGTYRAAALVHLDDWICVPGGPTVRVLVVHPDNLRLVGTGA